jgi:hypothetical protein
LPPPPPEPGAFALLGSAAGGDPNAPTASWGRDDSLGDDPLPRVVSIRWSIAALARLAMAWAKFVRQLRELPIPRWPRLHGIVPGTTDVTYEELRGEYVNPIAPPDEALERRAVEACRRVLALGLQHHFSDDHTRTCELWLSRHRGAEYHVLDEYRPALAPPRAAGDFAPAPR